MAVGRRLHCSDWMYLITCREQYAEKVALANVAARVRLPLVSFLLSGPAVQHRLQKLPSLKVKRLT